jgi:hypothetical protein
MVRFQQQFAWVAVLLLLTAPTFGLCTQRDPGAAPAGGCSLRGAEASCCCEQSCDSPGDAKPQQSPDDCPRMQRADDRLAPSPRASMTYQPVASPFAYWLPASFEPASVRQASLASLGTYHPLTPIEAKCSLLAQGCALNT